MPCIRACVGAVDCFCSRVLYVFLEFACLVLVKRRVVFGHSATFTFLRLYNFGLVAVLFDNS